MTINFIDLQKQQEKVRKNIEERIINVLDKGQYIMGPEVGQLEDKLAKYINSKYAISCGNGTDALLLSLMCINAKPQDAIFCPSFTFASTAEVIPCLGATPFFVDCELDTFNISVESLKSVISEAKKGGYNLKAVISVDLFGLPADYENIRKIADSENMVFISDAAQAFGAIYKKKKVGTLADIISTSFFPAKPLGCYGDGGAVFTNNDKYNELLRSYRVHGKGNDKYDNVRIGMNSRLDTLQAGILLEKLKIYDDEILKRNTIAEIYSEQLKEKYSVPFIPESCTSVWAQYTIRAKNQKERQDIMIKLRENNIPSNIYYPLPLHLQKAYKNYPRDPNGLPNSEQLSNTVISLPMHPYLSDTDLKNIIEVLLAI